MLTHAARMDGPRAGCVVAARADPHLAPYVAGFGGRAGDLGRVAELGGEAVGAAWLRLAGERPLGFGYATPTEPELAIGLEPAARGRGLGGRLLAELLEAARAVHGSVLLNVRAENPARRLYARHGFARVGEIENRVGTRSLVMRRDLAPPA